MKKFIIFCLCVLVVLSVFASCDSGKEKQGEKNTGNETMKNTETENETEAKTEEAIMGKKSIKILEIGNSFGFDAVAQIYPILEELGYEEIIIGALHYSACSVAQHVSFATHDKAVYYYYKTNDGEWSCKENSIMADAIADENWDIVTLMEHSSDAGIARSYDNQLPKLISYVKERLTNPDCKMYWHMTWAYNKTYNDQGFSKYDNDQMKMYNAITSTVSEKIGGNENFTGVIPSGTVIQNLRTTSLENRLERDNFHLSIPLGRYAAACVFACVVTGRAPSEISSYPDSPNKLWTGKQELVDAETYALIQKAVAAAIEHPYEITNIE